MYFLFFNAAVVIISAETKMIFLNAQFSGKSLSNELSYKESHSVHGNILCIIDSTPS